MNTTVSQGIRFKFVVSYMGSICYEVETAEEQFRVAAVFEASDYHRSIYNGSAERFDREVAAKVGCLVREHDISREIPLEVLDAFNAFRVRDYQGTLAWIDSKPGLREALRADVESVIPPPVAFKRARWDQDLSTWIQH